MLALYGGGATSTALAKKYSCDHTSVLYQIHKNGIVGQRRRITRPAMPRIPLPPSKYDYLFEEELNPGRNYLDYLSEEKRTKYGHISKN